ncbi:unnamed protein product [Mytilus coruscus]|uniref:DDE Tnp4 domain-containing protein n=1 Tax=Mytilus coruscus TaxID=42192 RepID=A0A6J8D6C2_MYTCO|nr:unnamed protein product [Mytilus coruscus]
MLKTNVEEIRDWVNEEDIFVLDRGFRDTIPLLEDLGIQAEMPRFLKKGDKQFSTEDANMSRLVTKENIKSINSGLDIMNHILTHGIAFAELELELLEHVLMLLLCCGILVKNCTKTSQCHMELGNWGEHVLDASVLPELIDGSDSESDASVVEE